MVDLQEEFDSIEEKLSRDELIAKALRVKELRYTEGYFAARDAADLLQAIMVEHMNTDEDSIRLFEDITGMYYRETSYKKFR